MKKITLFMLIVFTTITLHGQNKLLSSIDEFTFDEGVSWQIYSGTNYEYDSSNNLITETRFTNDFSTSSLSNSSKATYEYNASNKITLETDFQWNKTTSLFEFSYMTSYSYLSGMFVIETQKRVGLDWVKDQMTEITLDSNGFASAISYTWDGSQYVKDIQDTLTYGSNNKISTDLSEKWNGSGWDKDNQTSLTYNANNNIITNSSADYDGSVFNETDRTDYVLDATGNRASETMTSTGSIIKQDYTYDTSSLMSSFANPFKDKTGGDYIFEDFPYVNKVLAYYSSSYNSSTSSFDPPNSRTTYDYNNSIVLATEKIETADVTIAVYPNPAKDFLSIQTSLNTDVDKVIVTDLSGKIVVEQNQNASKVNVQNLDKGMYLVQVFSGDKNWQSKFLKE